MKTKTKVTKKRKGTAVHFENKNPPYADLPTVKLEKKRKPRKVKGQWYDATLHDSAGELHIGRDVRMESQALQHSLLDAVSKITNPEKGSNFLEDLERQTRYTMHHEDPAAERRHRDTIRAAEELSVSSKIMAESLEILANAVTELASAIRVAAAKKGGKR